MAWDLKGSESFIRDSFMSMEALCGELWNWTYLVLKLLTSIAVRWIWSRTTRGFGVKVLGASSWMRLSPLQRYIV